MANSKRRCLNCKKYFPVSEGMILPVGYLHNDKCVMEYSRKMRVKHEKQSDAAAKKKFRATDRSFHVKKAQSLFNKFIRLRDEGNNCISCGKPPKKKNAGHYKSRGSYPELKFEPLNCHLQCEYCNTHLSGNLSHYRVNLISKIGIDKVDWLEGPHVPKRYTLDDLKQIQEVYKRKTKELGS